jgi:DNA-binding CsgD family transcriptional regulator
MENLTLHDIQNLNQCIQQIYTLHDLDTFAVRSLLIVDQLIPSDFPLFHLTDVRTGQVQDTFLPDYPHLTPEMSSIKSRHLNEHPIAQNISQALQGACKISDFLSQKELQSLEGLYQEFLRPLETEDQMMLFLPSTNSGNWDQLAIANTQLVGYAFGRTQRSFTERDRLLLNLLRPHLFQAYCNAQKYHYQQQRANQLQDSLNHLGLIILDTSGQVQLITPQATKWLTTYFPNHTYLVQFPDRLWSWVKYQATKIIAETEYPQAFLPLCIQQSEQQLTIRLIIEKTEDRYILLLEEQTTSILDSLKLLGLSQRETEVLSWIMQGKDNQTIATQLGVGISTVRKHLESIYRQWGINSRTEAIAKTLQKLGLVNPLPPND